MEMLNQPGSTVQELMEAYFNTRNTKVVVMKPPTQNVSLEVNSLKQLVEDLKRRVERLEGSK